MKKLSFLLVLCGLVAACNGSTAKIEPDVPITKIYENAYYEFNKGHYSDAATEFQRAETQYPAHEFAADALVMAAYSYYMDDDFASSLLAADRFMRFHPGHPDVPYILYLRGMCYWRQVSDVRREPGMSVYAMAQFQQLVDRFPNSPYAKNAKNKIIILKNYIAGKVMYAARNEMRNKNWTSAISHLQTVISDAQETVMTPEALYRLTECYTAIGLPEQSAGYAEMLRTNFPDNEWTKKLAK